MRRRELTDREWARLAPRLPPERPARGRPGKDHRTMINALLWLDRTGAPWRDLPERYGPWQSVATRFYRWTKSGLWQQILAELQAEADAVGGLDCSNSTGSGSPPMAACSPTASWTRRSA